MPDILTRITQRRNARGVASLAAQRSVEFGRLGTGPLELKKVWVGREGHRGVPELARFLAARNFREHRPEERHTVDVDGWRADVVADRVHPGVVTLAQRVVVS